MGRIKNALTDIYVEADALSDTLDEICEAFWKDDSAKVGRLLRKAKGHTDMIMHTANGALSEVPDEQD